MSALLKMTTTMTQLRPRPLTLIILDGWGCRDATEANAIAAARKPTWDALLQRCPHTRLSGSGRCVGLPDGQMGNSEVGHLNMGAGRIVRQDLTRIDSAIQEGSFFTNPILKEAFQLAKTQNKAVHVIGLLSPGGVHSYESHWWAMVDFAAREGVNTLYFHPFLDGRDTPPKSALASLQALETRCAQANLGKIASLIGRYYAMDRDKRWERVQKAYDLLTQGKAGHRAATAQSALEQAYARGETDEFVQPTVIHPDGVQPVTIGDGEVVLFMNFRADRARELTQAFVDSAFNGFTRERIPALARFVCLSEYDSRFSAPVAFPSVSLQNIFAEYISRLGLSQLRIAETEKYAHVTFFFNGGIEKPFEREERILIPSPKVATYDSQPEMSAPALTDRLNQAILSKQYDVIIVNFANPDMVGHTGNFDATVKAIEVIDTCLGRILQALQETGGEALISADHGNAEQMFDPLTQQPHTAHTSDPVPFIYVGRPAKIVKENGKLSDIAPTMLYLLGLPIPTEMTGQTLLSLS